MMLVMGGVVALAGGSGQLLIFRPGCRGNTRGAGRDSVPGVVTIVVILLGRGRGGIFGPQEKIDPSGPLLAKDADGVQEKSPVVDGENPDGVQVRGSDLFDHLQLVVAVVEKGVGIVSQLEKAEPFHHDVVFSAADPLPLRGGGRRRRRHGGRRSEGCGHFYNTSCMTRYDIHKVTSQFKSLPRFRTLSGRKPRHGNSFNRGHKMTGSTLRLDTLPRPPSFQTRRDVFAVQCTSLTITNLPQEHLFTQWLGQERTTRISSRNEFVKLFPIHTRKITKIARPYAEKHTITTED